ncbi:MAG: metalloregulator ArsR/SmtB family transcription factor [Armatimonadetes bacterium]|nr:metalloregulator ArsR/SmtB family transcription factor [Armatimonadota bacterium]
MSQPSILKHLTTVSDPTRCRVLRILGEQELTVSELCAVVQLPQSTVSRHLKALGEDGWIGSRRQGTSRFYSMSVAELTPPAVELWRLVEGELGSSAEVAQDRRRLEEVLEERRSRSREFFAGAAGQWDRLRVEMYGAGFQGQALLGLLDERWIVGDLGCGTGPVAGMVAPFVARVVAVDGSVEMLTAARERLAEVENVEFRQGELESLPLEDGALDAAILSLVLHYVSDPAAVLREAGRVLRPGGRLLIVDLLPHDREELAQKMGHVWLGFPEAQMERFLAAAGFGGGRVQPLAPDPAAEGPGLFAASARREA